MRHSIALAEINPCVRYASAGRLSASVANRTVCAPDCRLFFLMEGACRLRVGDEPPWTLERGDACLVPAGIPYALLMEPEDSAPLLFIANFDYTQDRRGVTQPMPLRPGTESLPEADMPPRITDCPALNGPLLCRGAEALLPLVETMRREKQEQRRFYERQLSAAMTEALTALMRLTLWDESRKTGAVDRMIAYIQAHYSRPLTNEEIAGSVNYHPVYANRLMRLSTGMTLHQYLLSCRIQRSLDLLLCSDLSVTEVALAVGFTSASRFSKDFRQATGHTPSAFRRSGGE